MSPPVLYYEFEKFRLSPREKRLWHDGQLLTLAPKALETLLALVENAGEAVSKEELLDRIWADTFVEETGLARNISVVRKTLEDAAQESQIQFIETIPRLGYRFACEVQTIYQTVSTLNSLAVLPFRVISERAEDEHLGFGLADTLITLLSNFRELIIRPTSAVALTNEQIGLPVERGRRLRAEWVLDGTLLRIAESLRLSVQLINVAEERVVWAGRFETGLVSVLTLQDSLTQQLGQTLIENLGLSEQAPVFSNFTVNDEAHRAYLRGQAIWRRLNRENIQQAASAFEQAIRIDPNFALAYSGLSNCLILFDMFDIAPPDECFPKAKIAAQKALQLNPNLSEAQTSLAYINYRYDWDWEAADLGFQKAITLNPNYALARHWYGVLLATMRRFDEAIAQFDVALEIDPLSSAIRTGRLNVFYFQRDFDTVLDQIQEIIKLDANHDPSLELLASIYSFRGEHERAIEIMERAVSLTNRISVRVGMLGIIYARAGRFEKMQEIISELNSLSKNTHISLIHFAGLYAVLGNTDKALEYVEKMYDQRDNHIQRLTTWLGLDVLRNEPRFVEVMRKLKFPTTQNVDSGDY